MAGTDGPEGPEARVITALRRVASGFADPALAPDDAGDDGVAVRREAGEGEADGVVVVALVAGGGCPVEVRVPDAALLAPEAPGMAQSVFDTLVREAGGHRIERETLILHVGGRADAGTIVRAYRRRLAG